MKSVMRLLMVVMSASLFLAAFTAPGLQPRKPEALAGSQEPSALKVAVDLVSLSVTVTDAKGRMVPGLQKEDSFDHIQEGNQQKKVLVVVTDGEDNFSRIEFRRLLERIERKRDVAIYPVGMFEQGFWWERRRNPLKLASRLRTIAETTGASAHFPSNVKECRKAMTDIAREVSQHYSLGYYPSNTAGGGKWRRIQVEVVSGGGKGQKYSARTRTGYYAAERESNSNGHHAPNGQQ